MRKLFLLFLTVCSFLALAMPAQAEHADVDLFVDHGEFDAVRWADSGTEDFCLSPDWYNDPDITVAKRDEIKNTTEEAFRRWYNNSDLSKTFSLRDPAKCDQNINMEAGWQNAGVGKSPGESLEHDYCEHHQQMSSTIQYEDLDTYGYGVDWRTVAITITCDTNDDGYLDAFVMVIDNDRPYQWGYGSNPAVNEVDFLGLMNHESGHVIGFDKRRFTVDGDGHFDQDKALCNHNYNDWNTLCPGGWGDAGETASRTLNVHDTGMANLNYP